MTNNRLDEGLHAAEERDIRRAKSGLPDLTTYEPNSETSEFGRLHYALAFGGAVLLHASTALGLAYWEPPEPVAPPGEMVITVDLEPAALPENQVEQAGAAAQSAPQTPAPPEEETKKEEVVEEEPLPAPEPVAKEEAVEVPKTEEAEEAEVVISPKQEKKEKKKPRPAPAAPSQAAASSGAKKSDVSGRGASASPNEINAYAGRVRAAIERNKKAPAGGATGTAHIAFSITRSGGISGLRISRSSGTPTLDGAARAAVASAGIPPIPEALPAPMSFGVPINFK